MEDVHREPIESISMAAMFARHLQQGVYCIAMCRSGRCEDVLILTWQLDEQFGAKAAESKLAQGPDRRGTRSFAIATALGKVMNQCVL